MRRADLERELEELAAATRARAAERFAQRLEEIDDYGGAVDGMGNVCSDADPGL
jgi:hypothetical protein